ncbi:MAG: class I SAM-dependent methyltransferase [Proteobacteria bacterium]|nr:class I SAM-dependent methyltransferase [Pseudomonadota bacterium]
MPHLARRTLLSAGLALPLLVPAVRALAAGVDPLLAQAIDNPRRKAADRARDAWRHPGESLTFWGLKPGMTVIDVGPGAGWWTDILAPYLAATHGRYIAAGADLNNPKLSEGARKDRAAFEAKYADHAVYGDVSVAGFGRVSGPLAPPASVDFALVSREMHNWAQVDGFPEKALGDLHAALKTGGILAVEDHRAPDGADPRKGDGYISEAWVIDKATKAGFRLDGRSEINANPKDTKDHPFGVWTLPPTRQSAPSGQPANPAFDHAKYDAIGESDRMTLRFVKA